jgi:hypothetical protein
MEVENKRGRLKRGSKKSKKRGNKRQARFVSSIAFP